VQHAQASAERAAQVGCTPRTVALIREHHSRHLPGADAPEDRQAALLRWADEQN
jgi:hypothetical protein